jgi:hypothetical protein
MIIEEKYNELVRFNSVPLYRESIVCAWEFVLFLYLFWFIKMEHSSDRPASWSSGQRF